ncbi:hypothetical protein STTU_0815 [Streptomyces sp. Tu6071]|nr:hypothetical protein STTU_0815 [Streptomyces sp. Tu6071]
MVHGPLWEAQEVATRLHNAFKAVGIRLPSVQADLPSCSLTTDSRDDTRLIDLGRLPLREAERLTDLLRDVAGRKEQGQDG